MSDPILSARLGALEHELKQMANPLEWRRALELEIQIDERVWTAFDNVIREEVLGQLNKIKQAQEMLEAAQGQDSQARRQTLRDAWALYGETFNASQEVFSECHEFIGGLVFREKGLDDSICQVADELIGSCATITAKFPSLTVPTARESLKKTLGRIVRVRYPDWSIWTLPMVAHEYGHVVDDETPKLKEFIKQVAAEWDAEDAQSAVGKGGAKQDNVRHIEEFMADAFAVYTMGPVYVYAAILLRLNPANATRESEFQPGDVKRALVVMKMLEMMDANATWNPYQKVISYLREKWAEALTWAWSRGPLAPEEVSRLENLVGRLWGIFNQVISRALYPSTLSIDRDGWNVAIEWHGVWRKDLENGAHLTNHAVTHSSKLRDALNAAWLCRMDFPQYSERIAAAALGLCNEIIKEQQKARRKRIQNPTRKAIRRRAS